MKHSLEDLAKLAEQLEAARAEVKNCEHNLADAKEVERELSEDIIPNALRELGLDELKTSNGLKLTIAETVHARISKDDQAEAFEWLDQNGFGSLTKREVRIPFDRSDADKAAALCEELQSDFEAVNLQQTIHPSTLRAFAREMVEDGEEFPRELFGVYQKKVTKITK